MALTAGETGPRCRFALRSAGTTSPAPHPGSGRGEGGLEAAFPPARRSAGVCGQRGCPSPSWGAGVGGPGPHRTPWDKPVPAVLCPASAIACARHRCNTRAGWGGSNPLVAFWKREGFTFGAVGPPKGVRRLTFHPCFLPAIVMLWGLEQLLCSTPKAAAAFAEGEQLL